jgi:hypothetical protein
MKEKEGEVKEEEKSGKGLGAAGIPGGRECFVLWWRQQGCRWAFGSWCFDGVKAGAGLPHSILVASQADPAVLDGFCQPPADGAEDKCRNVAFGFECEVGGLPRKLDAAIQVKTCVLQELSGEGNVFGPIDTPEPEFLFIALKEPKGFFQLLHGAVEGRSEKENAKIPCMAWVLDPNANTILAGLVQLDTATVVIPNMIAGTAQLRFSHK